MWNIITIRNLVILFLAAISGPIAFAGPLFESSEPLEVVLELPVEEVLREAKERPTVPGLLRYTNLDGNEVVLDVALTTRGNSRLSMCSYPPLQLNLKRKQIISTVFEGQNKLKMVTQCHKSASSLRYLEQEYIIYRIYNLLSPYSFRVRRLEVTFRDSAGKRKDAVHMAFLIESEGEAAARLGMAPVKEPSVSISQLDAGQLSIFTLFQFMIGNTDWSVRKGPGNENCCHNGKLIGLPDSDSGWVVLPYDFDQSGLVNANYAMPSEQLPIRTVRQRLYRGFCSTNDELERTIELFNNNRTAIEELFSNKKALKYVQDFYEIINDPDKRQKKIAGVCQRTRN